MGNYRFKLSDIMPNAWFYKLKDMNKSRKRNKSHSNPMKNRATSPTISHKSHFSNHSYSNYYSTEIPIRAGKFYTSPVNLKASDTTFPDSPRRSSKRRARRKTIYKPSPRVVSSSVSDKQNQVQSPDYYVSSFECSSESNLQERISSESDDLDVLNLSNEEDQWSSSYLCRVSSSTADIILDMNKEPFARTPEKLDGYDSISESKLLSMFTKQANFNSRATQDMKLRSSSILEDKEAQRSQRGRKPTPLVRKSYGGMRLRPNSPKLASKRVQSCGRKSVSRSRNISLLESFAVVKASLDPERDFRDSMVEMIVEKNIKASKDLEDLLACYLQLNSTEYHELIVKTFEQIWFDMDDLGI